MVLKFYFCFNCKVLFVSFVTFILHIGNTDASLGDSFPSYKHCVKSCKERLCDAEGYNYKDDLNPLPLTILNWRCVDDCRYKCMWSVVDSFAIKGWPPPQFHGKWPFVRWLGMQEPASVLFSILNLFVTVIMLQRYYKEIRPGGPMYWCWTFYAFHGPADDETCGKCIVLLPFSCGGDPDISELYTLSNFILLTNKNEVCVNAWVWSAIFHTRDLPFTEIMDYLSAFAMVFYSLYGILMRMLLGAPFFFSLILTLVFLSFFLNHAAYLLLDQFDYQYNMTANITIGILSAGCSSVWCLLNWKKHSHSRHLFMCLIWGLLTLLLEISDFPPIVWTFDAHALWHLSTVPVPYLFWSFVIEDCKYLRKTYVKER